MGEGLLNKALSFFFATKTRSIVEDWEYKPVIGPSVERRKDSTTVDLGF